MFEREHKHVHDPESVRETLVVMVCEKGSVSQRQTSSMKSQKNKMPALKPHRLKNTENNVT